MWPDEGVSEAFPGGRDGRSALVCGSQRGLSLALLRPLDSRFRESARTFLDVLKASRLSFDGVLEGFSIPVRAIETFTAPALGALKVALPPRLRF